MSDDPNDYLRQFWPPISSPLSGPKPEPQPQEPDDD